MFLCGDNDAAKARVCGGIIASRALEPLCMLWCIPGFRNNQ